MKELTLEWIAGFYEGEGGCYWQHGRTHCPVLYITQKETEPLVAIQEFFEQFGIYGKVYQNGTCHKYIIGSQVGFLKIARALSPYLRTAKKREQLRKVMEQYKEYRAGSSKRRLKFQVV